MNFKLLRFHKTILPVQCERPGNKLDVINELEEIGSLYPVAYANGFAWSPNESNLQRKPIVLHGVKITSFAGRMTLMRVSS